jgi:hypothetical protein
LGSVSSSPTGLNTDGYNTASCFFSNIFTRRRVVPAVIIAVRKNRKKYFVTKRFSDLIFLIVIYN